MDLSSRKLSLGRAVLIGLAVLFFATVFVVRIGGDMVDFEVNYRAGERVREGESLYRTSDGHFMFKYLPFAALCYVPISYVPLGAAKALWYGLSVLGAILLFVVSKRIVSGSEPLPPYLAALAPVVLAKFFFREMKLGQINIFVTLLLLWMLVEILAGREKRAGALWGFATEVKPYGFIFLPYWIIRRNWVALASGLAVLGAAFLLPAAFYGLERNVAIHGEWLQTLSESTPAQLKTADNVSIAGFLAEWNVSPALAFPLVTLLAGLVLAVFLHGRKHPRSSVLEVAMLLVLIPLVSPLGWDYQLLTSVLAVTLLARHWADLWKPCRAVLGANLFIAAFSIYDIIGRQAYRTCVSWSVLTLSFLIVVGFLASLRWRRLA